MPSTLRFRAASRSFAAVTCCNARRMEQRHDNTATSTDVLQLSNSILQQALRQLQQLLTL